MVKQITSWQASDGLLHDTTAALIGLARKGEAVAHG